MTVVSLLRLLSGNAACYGLVPGGTARPRKGDLGGNPGHCESRISGKRFLDTFHRSHSRDNVDFKLCQNAKVVAFRSKIGVPRASPTKVADVCALSAHRPATHNRINNEGRQRAPD